MFIQNSHSTVLNSHKSFEALVFFCTCGFVVEAKESVIKQRTNKTANYCAMMVKNAPQCA